MTVLDELPAMKWKREIARAVALPEASDGHIAYPTAERTLCGLVVADMDVVEGPAANLPPTCPDCWASATVIFDTDGSVNPRWFGKPPRCVGVTFWGKGCLNPPASNSDYCYVHEADSRRTA